MNIIKRRYLFFLISLIVIIPGVLALIFWKLPLAIDFTGGSMLEIQFPADTDAPQPADIIAVYNSLDIQDPQVQSSDQGVFVIRSKEIPEETKAQDRK